MAIEPSTTAPEQGETTLLHTRTTAPRPNVRTLARPDLLAILDEGTRHAVTLICGGPGSGKTQLVTAWVDSVRGGTLRVAWVALGRDCNDPQRLWSLVTTALSRATDGSWADLRPPADADEVYVARLLSSVDHVDAPVVLVLEDLHEVQGRESLRSIDLLLTMLPDAVRVVLLSRSDPALSLHRLRVSSELTEIRQAALAFDRTEAVDLLAQHEVALEDAEVDLLLERTEGWAVGLRLAALSLEGRGGDQRGAAVAAFAGDNRAVADYLVAEVLDRVPAELRRFLLLTSVVDRVDGALAEHLTGTTGGAAALERLERDGVPLVPLDEHQQWYRYHRLVQDVCRHRLLVEDPDLVPQLHVAAAQWLAGTGEHEEALRHALVARDWTLVGRLSVTHAGPLVFGHAGRTVRAVLSEIPDDVASGDPWVAAARALALHDQGRPDRLTEQLELAEAMSGELPGPDALLVGLVLALLRASAARARYDVDLAAVESRRAGELAAALSIHVDQARAVPALAAYAAHADTLLGKSLVWQGDFADAEVHLRRAVAAAPPERPDPVDSGILARAYLSLVLAMAGSTHEAGDLAEGALSLGRAAGWSDDVQSTAAWLALVLVRLQRSDRDGCSAALDAAALVLERRPDQLLDAGRWLATARFLAEDGRDARSRDILADVRRILADLPHNGFLSGWHQLVAAEVELAAGRPAEARKLIEEDPVVRGTPAARIVRGQALVDQGLSDEALAEVEPLVDYLEGGLRSVQALVICAQAHDLARRDAKALQCLIDALAQAVPDDYLRPVYRNRIKLLPLLRRYRLSGAPHFEVVATVLALDDNNGHRPIENLTDRELAVLQLLPSMMSNEEIAAELFVSVNTVKVHLKSLYRKLGVSSRREAVLTGAGLIER
jgi:LuxR family transcriptional regulator, maltose regulon positive regulatory protein